MKEIISEIPIDLKKWIYPNSRYKEWNYSGIIIPDETYNRFARVLKTYEGIYTWWYNY